ncbi:MAG TPA: hypothetical protein VF533_04045, partial [Solirubrobacteraceae bacterium]
QKYADAALHERYLRALASHREAMLVVLNQADRLDGAAVAACRADIGRLLAEDGLPGLPVLAVSARDGRGLDDLQGVLRDRAAARAAATARLAADVGAAAGRLAEGAGCGRERAGKVGRGDRERLVATLADAAGVPAVTRAVARSHRRRGSLDTGWPVARWVGRLRPDPLKRLGLGRGDGADAHTSLPPATPAQRSQVESAVRTLAAGVAGELPAPWPGLVRGAAGARGAELPARLDRVMAGADLVARRPRWWALAGGLQRVLALVAAAGALWLVGLAALGWLQLSDAVPLPELEGIPLPTLLLAAGVLGGLLLALLARWLIGIGAARRARTAERALRRQVDAVAEELIVAPVTAELGTRETLCGALRAASGARKV